jgi:predicted HAD superfamily Cof-like phosphohydrolase
VTAYEDVLEFQIALDLTVGDFGAPDITTDQAMRLRLIEEELQELRDALAAGDVVGAADALADLQYVVNGAAVTWGIWLDWMHDEVHRSNMTKRGGVRRADGKLLKPPGYEPPDLESVFERQVTLGVSHWVAAVRKRHGR